MRPRVIPAEVHDPVEVAYVGDPASMRPRVIPAEVALVKERDAHKETSFNEAAGHPRGSPRSCGLSLDTTTGFNEAAGHPRGSHGGPGNGTAAGNLLQ